MEELNNIEATTNQSDLRETVITSYSLKSGGETYASRLADAIRSSSYADIADQLRDSSASIYSSCAAATDQNVDFSEMIDWQRIEELASQARYDDKALSELMRSGVLQWICGFFKNSDPRCPYQDMTQDVACKIVQHRTKFDPRRGAFKAWLRTVARNQLIDHFQFAKRKPPSFDPSETQVLDLLPGEDLEVNAALEACIDKLSTFEHTVVTARYFHHLELKQVAQTLCRPESTVRDWHQRAIRKLLKCLQKKGFS